jgi:hypothetical protein
MYYYLVTLRLLSCYKFVIYVLKYLVVYHDVYDILCTCVMIDEWTQLMYITIICWKTIVIIVDITQVVHKGNKYLNKTLSVCQYNLVYSGNV